MLEHALSYAARGWCVIPLRPRDKRPALASWQEHQQRRAAEEEIRAWWSRWPGANVGVVTGAVSVLVVLDLDGPEVVNYAKERGVPQTPVVATGKGFHVYFQHPGRPVPNAAALAGIKGLDLRGDGGYVVAPPSLHPSGRRYAWCKGRSPDDLPLAPMPDWLLELMETRNQTGSAVNGAGKEPGWVEALLRGVPEGQRDDACTRLAGHFLAKGLPESEVLALLLAWNEKNTPPLPEAQVEKCVRSVARREAAKPRPARRALAGGNGNGLRLPGRVAVPECWDGGVLVLAGDWESARSAYAAGHAVVVAYPDGRVPPEAGPLLRRAGELRAEAAEPEAKKRLEWLLAPLVYARLARQAQAAAEVGESGGPAPETLEAPKVKESEASAALPQEPAAEVEIWEGDIEEVIL